MMKITKTAFALLISASMVLAGCQSADNGTVSDKASSSDTSESDNLADTSVSDTSASDTSASETSQSDSANGDTENSDDNTSKAQLPASEEDLYAFMEGEWNFFNTDTMNDYGHIVISADGSFDYGYIGEEETCTGDFKANHLYEAEENVPLTLTISVSGIDNISFDEDLVYVPEDGTADSNVKIYYGSCDGEDYVFFEETGNGDTFIGNYLFQDPETFDGSYPMFAASCVMHRASNESAGEAITNDSFYAWVWKADEGGIWTQEMKPLTWDAEDEYTLDRYNAAAFTPSDLSSVYYEYTDSVDKRVLLNGQRLDMECPRYMCRVTVNDEGMIENLEEVDAAYNGIYVLGEIEAEISYDGMIFTYNGVDFDLSEEGASTAIMNVYSAYGK
uniref:hypothetical protein n=1 Tax=Butyrivibrio sp. TaxID=28121 RepID=UPI0025FFF635